MIEIPITNEMRAYAEEQAKAMGVLRNSITSGVGNIVGFLGELVAQKAIGGMIMNTYDYDILLDDFLTKVDVKTKTTTVAPLPHYDCSVASLNLTQNCDYYCFVRIKKDLSVGWYLGRCKKTDYLRNARQMLKGQLDPDNDYIVKSDCFNMKISELDHTI